MGGVAEGDRALHGSGEYDAEGAGEAPAAVVAGLGAEALELDWVPTIGCDESFVFKRVVHYHGWLITLPGE